MARLLNAYRDPTPEIGQSLATAIFGDPAAAARQRDLQAQAALREAQRQEALAHGGLYTEQTRGVHTANDAQTGLPGLFRTFAQSQQPVVPQRTDTAGFGDFDTPMPAPPPHPDKAMALANLIAGMGQMNGDKIDPTKMMGAWGAFGGDDETARRALVAQGHSPTANFALTPQRADAIAAQDDAAKQAQAFGVARINHSNDVPVANIRASASRYGSDQHLAGVQYASDGTLIKGSSAPGFDAIQAAFPTANMNSGWRSPEHNREVGGVSDSTHLGMTPGVQGYDMPVQPGITIDQAKAMIEQANGGRVKVIEARDERGRVGPNGKPLGGWHFALQAVGGAQPGKKVSAFNKPPKAPPKVTGADTKQITAMVDQFATDHNVSIAGTTRDSILAKATTYYQQTGNMVQAVQQATSRLRVNGQTAGDRDSRGNGPPVHGARQAPDGNWYVQIGTNHDGTPRYGKVN